MWPFSKKKKKVPYTPQGRIGYKRIDSYPYQCVIVVEQLVVVREACKFRVLEVSIDRDCDKSKTQCLRKWGAPDWINLSSITWETETQWRDRLGQPITYDIDEDELEEEVKYRLTPHNFINNE